jgi:hypothetical protein
LALDSRSRPLAAGVRSAAATAYRLLYAAGAVEVELMVEPQNGVRIVAGEVLAEEDVTGPFLIELSADAADAPAYTTESSAEGRFHLDRVAPGRYQLTITGASGPAIAIHPLELT